MTSSQEILYLKSISFAQKNTLFHCNRRSDNGMFSSCSLVLDDVPWCFYVIFPRELPKCDCINECLSLLRSAKDTDQGGNCQFFCEYRENASILSNSLKSDNYSSVLLKYPSKWKCLPQKGNANVLDIIGHGYSKNERLIMSFDVPLNIPGWIEIKGYSAQNLSDGKFVVTAKDVGLFSGDTNKLLDECALKSNDLLNLCFVKIIRNRVQIIYIGILSCYLGKKNISYFKLDEQRNEAKTLRMFWRYFENERFDLVIGHEIREEMQFIIQRTKDLKVSSRRNEIPPLICLKSYFSQPQYKKSQSCCTISELQETILGYKESVFGKDHALLELYAPACIWIQNSMYLLMDKWYDRILCYVKKYLDLFFKLCEKSAIIEKGLEMASYTNAPISSCILLQYVIFHESLLLKEMLKNHIIFPSVKMCGSRKTKELTEKDESTHSKKSLSKDGKRGGRIIDSIPGIYNDSSKTISILDYSGFYNSIAIKNKCEIKGLLCETPFLCSLFEKEAALRKEKIQNGDAIGSAVIKLVSNSRVGCFSHVNFRFKDEELFQKITEIGRENHQLAENICKERNIKVLFGHTDGLVVSSNSSHDIEEARKEVQSKSGLVFSYEKMKIYSMIMHANKRYAYLLHEDSPEIGCNGTTNEKLSIPKEIRRMITEMYSFILRKGEENHEDIAFYICKRMYQTIHFINNEESQVQDLVVFKKLGKSPNEYKSHSSLSHVVLAKNYAQKTGFIYKKGDLVPMIYCEGSIEHSDSVLENPKLFKIDKNFYVKMAQQETKNLCKPPTSSLYHSLIKKINMA